MPSKPNKQIPLSRFSSEADLVEEILRQKISFFSHKRKKPLFLLTEFDCSNLGVADVILFTPCANWEKKIQYGKIPARWVYALRVMPYRKCFSLETFMETTGVSKKRSLQALNQYCQLGFCKKGQHKNTWTKEVQPRPIANTIIAIEAKLHNWKRALKQAYRYLDYASQSWVVLNSLTPIPPQAIVNDFKKLNVGLKILEKSGNVTSPFIPIRARHKSDLKFWEANGIIAASLLKNNRMRC